MARGLSGEAEPVLIDALSSGEAYFSAQSYRSSALLGMIVYETISEAPRNFGRRRCPGKGWFGLWSSRAASAVKLFCAVDVFFTECFDDGILAPWARRTARLDLLVHHLGLALGGRPAASFARRLN